MKRLYIADDATLAVLARNLAVPVARLQGSLARSFHFFALSDYAGGDCITVHDKYGPLAGARTVTAEDLGKLVAERMAVDPPPDRCRSAVLLVFLSSGPDHFVLWSKIAVGGDGQGNTIGCREFVVSTRATAAEELLRLVAAARRKFSRTKVRVMDAAGFQAGPGCPFEAAVKLYAGEELSDDEYDLLSQAMQAVSGAVMAKLG